MKKVLKITAIIASIAIIVGILLINHYGPILGMQLIGKPVYVIPPSPERYGEIAIEIMDTNGIYTNDEKWQKQKEKALSELETISSYEEAHDVIEQSIRIAGGKHSFFLTNQERDTYYEQDQKMPKVERRDNLLYINLPAIANAKEYGKEYAEVVLNGLKENQDVKGIIIDLQANSGGDMGPMITAISPLLPDGEILYFSFRNQDIPVTLIDGLVSGGGSMIETDIEPFKLEFPVAVLMSSNTASSGEATLMSLMELDNVQTFGPSSMGYATANMTYFLSDDAMMLLTVANMKTINGQVFGDNRIPADVKTTYPNALKEATKWLEEINNE